jgi:acyl dehydratase
MVFEEMSVGQSFRSSGRTVTEAEIILFAHTYDPQTMHLDTESSAQGPFAGLIASGFLTLNLAWWLFLRLGLVQESMYVGLGLDRLRWLKPVRPGDTLTLTVVVEAKGEVRRGRGLVTFAHTLANQAGDPVMTYASLNLIRTGGTA